MINAFMIQINPAKLVRLMTSNYKIISSIINENKFIDLGLLV